MKFMHRAETRVVFTRGFAKRCEFLLVSLGEGFGIGFREVVGGGFPVKMREKGKGVGGGAVGVGTGKGTGKSMLKLYRNYPLATYPLKSARMQGQHVATKHPY